MESIGYDIIEQNFRCRIGEIDIIAKDKNTLVFVEVKYRSTLSYGYSGEAIDKRKQQKIYRSAEFYLAANRISASISCRFDAVLLDGNKISHIKNAFGGI